MARGKRFRREPKNYADFFERNRKHLFRPDYAPRPEDMKRGLQSVERVKKMVRSSDGSGYHFFFPLTTAASSGELIKGILHVVAPEARVTFLVTPFQGGTNEEFPTLVRHVSKALTPESHHGRIVDMFDRLKTLKRIKKAFAVADERKVIQSIKPEEDGAVSLPWRDPETGELHSWPMSPMVLYSMAHFANTNNRLFYTKYYSNLDSPDIIQSANLGWVKTRSGTKAMPLGHAQRYAQKHPSEIKYNPPAELRMSPKEANKKSALVRRLTYQLGIAIAKEYLRAKK